MSRRSSARHARLAVALALLVAALPLEPRAAEIRGSATYRAPVVGRVGVVAAGRNFATEAGMRILARGGNAIDAGVAATFAAAVTEISHFGLGGEAPLVLHLADRGQVVVVSGQGTAPAAATAVQFAEHGLPTSGPAAPTVPAVVDALAIALAEYGTLTLADVLEPALAQADGFPWYDALTTYLRAELANVRRYPSGARVYLQGPEGGIPRVGSVFRQPDLARTLRGLADEELLKTGFWGQGPVLLQTLALLDGIDLVALGHNSAAYIHTVSEALKLAFADRDAWYGDPDFARVPAAGLLSPAYAAERRRLIDPKAVNPAVAAGDPWRFEPRGHEHGAPRIRLAARAGLAPAARVASESP
ncbi:MAG: gamma-glutamyltransferase, partial [Candidatus Rokubacteria bacterium]|nr:gamma-glutamyltransferase [Candidatus Rokubacteria bacterium]